MLLHDARAVHDLASIRFKDFEVDGILFWVVAIITPAPTSGSATIPGAHINSDSGKLIAPPASQTVVVKKGTWKVLISAGSPGNQARISTHGPSRYRQESASCFLRTTTHRLSTAERSCADQRLLPLGLTSLARSACYSRNGLGTLLQPLILVNATGGYLIRLKSTRLTSESSNLFSQSRIHSLPY